MRIRLAKRDVTQCLGVQVTVLTVLYWSVTVVLVFAFLLAIQMRGLIGMALMRALEAEFDNADFTDSKLAIAAAGSGQSTGDTGDYLLKNYQRPLNHLRIARLWSAIAPAGLAIWLVLGKFVLGMF